MNLNTSFQNAHGKIPYGMTNDYMFRAVLQSNNKVLRGLICSLLHLTEKEVFSVEITNPIILGESIESKEVRLDISVLLNKRTIINLEMQVANRLNWQNRSVVYLCRSYDSLTHGQDYNEAKSAIHIGFLDYTLFHNRPEFYASYKLINVKNYQKYSDSITLNVIDLSQIDLATEEDKIYHIDGWAKLFKATTWEEVKMLAAKDENMREAAKSIFVYNTEEQIRKMCRDREEYYQDLRNYERAISDRDITISSYERALSAKDEQIQQLHAEIEKLKAMKRL
ncbi:MAG: Rpn family recombination-promoting nuclease/putative transposase [Lachnospiraceae bacterium]|nr:Rpn family recombination-promoting nuclease/putative transposase [Lachnospiraceae bacterium]